MKHTGIPAVAGSGAMGCVQAIRPIAAARNWPPNWPRDPLPTPEADAAIERYRATLQYQEGKIA